VVSVKIYVEGGGDSKSLQVQCREGFRKLIEKLEFTGRMPAIVAGGSRAGAYDKFSTAAAQHDPGLYPILLVDSEEPVEESAGSPDAPVAWNHLHSYDKWERPAGADNDQAQLMVTCMETWIMADHGALQTACGSRLQVSALMPADAYLEARSPHEVQQALGHATRNCGSGQIYRKGHRSFELLGKLNPQSLKAHLSHFRRFVATLERHLGQSQ